MKSEVLFQFLDELLDHGAFEDYPNALNGLQVEGPAEIVHVAAAVDGTEETISAAVAAGADLLLVHHGLFWDGFGPMTGRRYRRVASAVRGGLAVYASHLPLDAHPGIGNCARLASALGVVPDGSFGSFAGRAIGTRGQFAGTRAELVARLEAAVGGPVKLVAGGPDPVGSVAVITGAGSSTLAEAAAAGIGTLVTGEAPHHAAHDATEFGVNLLLGGHYATETFGVRALLEVLEEEFGLPGTYIDRPTGF